MNKYYNDDIKLGMKLKELERAYYFDELVAFLRDPNSNIIGRSHFGELKPLFDQFGYEKVIALILALTALEEESGESDSNDLGFSTLEKGGDN